MNALKLLTRALFPTQVNNSITTSKELYDFLLGGYGYETVAGINITPERAMTICAVQAAVRVLSESVAQLPCVINKELERGKEPARTHPLWQLLTKRPNDFQNIFEFWEMLMMHLLLWGNCFCYINKPNDKILELLPIHPNRVCIEQKPDYTLVYKITPPNGPPLTLSWKEVFHVRDGSLNGYAGNSRVHFMKEALGLAIRAESHGSAVFGNGARPAGLLTSPDKLNEAQMKQIRESWQAAHGGDKQMGTAVVDGGMDFKPLSYNSKDTQFIESRKFQIEEVARVFRVPPHMLMLMDRATNNNIEHQSLEFVKFSLAPWLRRIELAVDTQLLSTERNSPHSYKFQERGLLRGDQKSRSEYYTKMIASKVLNRNECREMEDLNPVEGGDIFENPNVTPGDTKNADDSPSKQQDDQ